jgi:hypothetical protein
MTVSPVTLPARKSFLSRTVRRSVLVMACVIGLPGCATLVTDDQQSIIVTSDPPGAACQVFQGRVFAGAITQTPGAIMVGKSRHDLAINCLRAGYYPGAAVLQPHFQDMTFGNILYGGTIGLIVDTSSGAINEYPRWVSVLMKRQPVLGESPRETERLAEIEAARHLMMRAANDR